MKRLGALGLICCLLAGFIPYCPLAATFAADNGAVVADLKDVLEKGLKARRPEEFAFIQTVLSHVQDGSLSVELVKGTFLWARNKPGNNFQYFQFGIRERAKRVGVTL